MSMYLKTSMKLTQQLRMTPQLQQAIKLLQLSRLELETAIRKELDENPILEESLDAPGEDERPSTETADSNAGDQDFSQDQDPRKQDEFEWEQYLDNQQKLPQSVGSGNEEIMNYENVISSKQTLYDHLMWQVRMVGFNDEELHAAEIIIGYIEDDGYIKMPLEQIAAAEDIEQSELEEILPFIHELDPPGVGARDLKECLLVQAQHLQEDTNDFVHLINHHLKDLEKKNYEGIAKAMGREVSEIIEMCKIIYSMDPKPGRAFMTQDTQYVTPDVYVYKVGDEYMVALNDEGVPRLRISNFYKNVLTGPKVDNGAQDYIQEKLRSAMWLIKSIHQRQRTIYKVTESIVKHQRDFFEHGPSKIRPMILRDIASDIGMHESTVSRVTTNKYVHTPLGIYELKYFFNSGIDTSDGDSLASESVKLKIKELVGAEDAKRPLSDQKIVELLKKDGIKIARRTVAKYRDVLRILPSSKRKKYF
jgi:RNA polymerase sigma-54 factor